MGDMLASRVLSRFLPVAEGDVSTYDGLRRDAVRRGGDVEALRHRMYTDGFQEDDDDDDPDTFLYDAAGDQPTPSDPGQSPEMMAAPSRQKWKSPAAKRRGLEDEDVPESLLLESRGKAGPSRHPAKNPAEAKLARAEAQWKASQDQQGLYAPRAPPSARPPSRPSRGGTAPTRPIFQPNPQAEATWMYTNAHNLDAFLLEVYQYFVQHGVWSILLSRVLTLLTELFAFSFTMFLTTCIDYSKLPTSKSTAEIVVPRCMASAPWYKSTALFFFTIYWLFKLLRYTRDVRRLFQMQDFFRHVLGVGDQDIQTVAWCEIVHGLVKVQNANIATAADPSDQGRKYLDFHKPRQRLNAEAIANRLMRQDNYYVAMYNKDLLDFTLPVPFLGSRHFYSRSLEWSINFCFTNFIFDETGSIRPFVLDIKKRHAQVEALRTRFRIAALVSVMVAPFTIGYNVILFFFKNYTEFTKNPSRAGARTFAPYAEWKMREFNELDHLFRRRLRQAHPFATEYLKQFPKDKTDQAFRFVCFVAGSVAAVLTIATLLDPELFLGFEVTPGRTAIYWLSVSLGVFGFANGSLPDDNDLHDPAFHMREVLLYTHYMPSHWKHRLHSDEVRAEFTAMFKLRLFVFAEELLSLIVTPLILWQNSGKTCERIIDFFREHTVHIDGIGHQCNFAYFNFKKRNDIEDPATFMPEPDGLRDDHFGLKDDKLADSVQNFMHYYSHYNNRQTSRRQQGWQPPPAWPGGIPAGLAEESGDAPPARHDQRSTKSPRNVAASALRSPRPAAKDSRRHSQRDQTGRTAATHLPDVTESRIMAQDSDLQDFADAPGVLALESDDDADEGDVQGAPGILGLATQFVKAQTEKATGPVSMT
jgi:autophagy-related protein 9